MPNFTQVIPASDSTYTSGNLGRYAIVVHYTAGTGSARNNGVYFSGGNRNASAHIFIDDTDTVLSVPLNDTAWACGNMWCNKRTISIEVVSDGEDFSQAEKDRLRECVLSLMDEYGISADNVIRHYDCYSWATNMAGGSVGRWIDPGKDCPHPYAEGDPDGSKWDELHSYITTAQQANEEPADNTDGQTAKELTMVDYAIISAPEGRFFWDLHARKLSEIQTDGEYNSLKGVLGKDGSTVPEYQFISEGSVANIKNVLAR